MINLNENEKLLKAKSYLEKLANGINPITNELASENDTINNIHISRCLFYVSDVLRNLIENNNNPQKKKNSKIPFSVTPQQLADYVFDDNPITVTEITKKLNSLIDTEEMKGIKTTSITNWLIKINMLEYLADENGKNHKIPTENGIQLGITTQERLGMYGSYKVVLYDSNVQQFILDNIDTIAYYNTQKKSHNFNTEGNI